MPDLNTQLLDTLTRIADALETANSLQMATLAKADHEREAPNLRRPLAAYADFDWGGIGADIIARDRFGATEVEWGGRVFKRYRSADDDEKGTDIRFRRVRSGTVAEHNLVWETLIKFADSRPAKPLRGELAERFAPDEGRAPAQPAPAAPSQSAPSPRPAPSHGQRFGTDAPLPPHSPAAAPSQAEGRLASRPNKPEAAPSQPGDEGALAPSQNQAVKALLAKGENNDKTIRAALAGGAGLMDLVRAVNGSNGPTLFWAACRHWFVARDVADTAIHKNTDHDRRITNWAGAILALRDAVAQF